MEFCLVEKEGQRANGRRSARAIDRVRRNGRADNI